MYFTTLENMLISCHGEFVNPRVGLRHTYTLRKCLICQILMLFTKRKYTETFTTSTSHSKTYTKISRYVQCVRFMFIIVKEWIVNQLDSGTLPYVWKQTQSSDDQRVWHVTVWWHQMATYVLRHVALWSVNELVPSTGSLYPFQTSRTQPASSAKGFFSTNNEPPVFVNL